VKRSYEPVADNGPLMSDATPIHLAADDFSNAKPVRLSDPGVYPFAHALLFTGHMIDKPDRTQPRFPAHAEEKARMAIRASVADMPWTRPGATIGMAAAASGGDILFHEVCAELGIATRIMLALPVDEFIATSVAPAGRNWVLRFQALLAAHGPENLCIMGGEDGLSQGETENIWQRANLWMIDDAVAMAPERALLALWDGARGDGPGGTEYFVQTAPRFGIRIAPPIEMQSLL
jgi:hypothetical protein